MIDNSDTFHERKRRRTEYYMRFVYKKKLVKCTACNGSGYYDNNGSPACSSCDGTGKCIDYYGNETSNQDED